MGFPGASKSTAVPGEAHPRAMSSARLCPPPEHLVQPPAEPTPKRAVTVWSQSLGCGCSDPAAAQAVGMCSYNAQPGRHYTQSCSGSAQGPSAFGWDFCHSQGDPKDCFTPAFPGISAQPTQGGSMPGALQESCNFFAKTVTVKSSILKSALLDFLRF